MLGEVLAGAGGNVVSQLGETIFRYIVRRVQGRVALAEIFEHGTSRDDADQVLASRIESAFAKAGVLNEANQQAIQKILAVGLVSHLLDSQILATVPHEGKRLIEALLKVDKGNTEPDFAQKFLLVLKECSGEIRVDQNSRKRIESRFRQFEQNIARALDEIGNGELFSDFSIESIGDYENFMLRIAEEMRVTLDDVDIHGASGEISRASLQKIFVESPLFLLGKSDVSTFRERIEHDSIYSASKFKGWRGLFDAGRQVVLLGDPGGGKSTHTKKLCCEIAELASKNFFYMPLFIQLRTFAAHRQKSDVSLFDYIAKVASEICPDTTGDVVRGFLNYNLGVGRAVIVFDGLDEVLSDPARHQLSREILNFARRYPLCRFIVTSRFVGYDVAPLDTFQHVAVGPLDEEGIARLYKNVCCHTIGMDMAAADNKFDRFFLTAREKARELISNPLLLTLIIIVENKKREIPDNRADLYSICAELLFDRWDRFRDINPDLPERYRLYDLLMFLSFQLYENAEYGGRVSKEELLRLTKSFFIQDYIDSRESKASEAATKFVEHLTGRAWILHEVGEKIFEFTHRTFMEFFYARYLAMKNELTEDLFGSLRQDISKGQKTVPAHLAFQMRAKDNRAVSIRITNSLISEIKNSNSINFVSFSAQAANYLLPSAGELEDLVDVVSNACIEADFSPPLLVLCSNEGPLGRSIRLKLIRSLYRIDRVPKLVKFARLLDELIRIRDLEPQEGKSELEDALKDTFFTRFEKIRGSSPFITKLLFDLGFDTPREILEKHGTRLWVNNHSRNFFDIRIGDGLTMMASLAGNELGGKKDVERYKQLAIALAVYVKSSNFVPYEAIPFRQPHIRESPDVDLKEVARLSPEMAEVFSIVYMFAVESAIEAMPYNYLKWRLPIEEVRHGLVHSGASSESIDRLEAWEKEEFGVFTQRHIFNSRASFISLLAEGIVGG